MHCNYSNTCMRARLHSNNISTEDALIGMLAELHQHNANSRWHPYLNVMTPPLPAAASPPAPTACCEAEAGGSSC